MIEKRRAELRKALKGDEGFLASLTDEAVLVQQGSLWGYVEEGPHPTGEQIYDYVLSALDSSEERKVRRHVSLCRFCANKAVNIIRIERALEIVDALPKDLQEYLFRTAEQADTVEEFLRSTMVGDCPICGSRNTCDGEESALAHVTVGTCLDCDTFWCLDCGEVLKAGQEICDHWQICNNCNESPAYGCEISILECPSVQAWIRVRRQEALRH